METSEKLRVAALVCALLLALSAPAPAKVLYVDDNATGTNDGSSWANAYPYLQDALASANNLQVSVEIRVAQGTYKPDCSSARRGSTRDRDASFRLLDDVAIMGGFAGVGAPDPNARDVVRYATVLSGDLAGNDAPVLDPCDLLTEPTRTENTYHILTAEPCGRSAVLDGFTIRGGRADYGGGGLHLGPRPCLPSIRNCTFVGNSADDGAAVYLSAGIYPELINCLFLKNAASGSGGVMAVVLGRALYPRADEFVVRGCTFAWNSAGGIDRGTRGVGGAIYIGWKSPFIIENCTFVGNRAWMGGAIYSHDEENIVNCRFVQNVAYKAGGAVYFGGTDLNVTSCTFSDNMAPSAGACYAGDQAELSITNTILWDGGDEIEITDEVGVNITYSDVQGGWPGEGNIDKDPLFADPGHWDPNGTPDDPNDDVWVEGDYHLRSQAGRWDPAGENWALDEVTSACIDAGDPNSPVGDEPEPNGGRVNMGAYGGTAEASKSYLDGQ